MNQQVMERGTSMDTVIRDVTLETVNQAIANHAGIKPGEHFDVVVVDTRPRLADIAAKMRSTAVAKGLTEEIFDNILNQQ
jgi:hypothetical protein